MNIKMLHSILPSIPYDQLQEGLKMVQKEIERRENGSIVGWRCTECGEIWPAEQGETCVAHVRTVHKYPEEDANLSSRPMYQ